MASWHDACLPFNFKVYVEKQFYNTDGTLLTIWWTPPPLISILVETLYIYVCDNRNCGYCISLCKVCIFIWLILYFLMTLEYAKNHLHNRQTDRWTDRQMQSDRLLLIRAGLKTNTHTIQYMYTHTLSIMIPHKQTCMYTYYTQKSVYVCPF